MEMWYADNEWFKSNFDVIITAWNIYCDGDSDWRNDAMSMDIFRCGCMIAVAFMTPRDFRLRLAGLTNGDRYS